MRSLKGLFCVLLLLLFIAPCAGAAEVTLRFAGQFPDGHYATKLMRDIAGGVNQRTNGRITIEVYPANKLGDYQRIPELRERREGFRSRQLAREEDIRIQHAPRRQIPRLPH